MIFPKNIAGKVARGEATLTIRPATARPPAHGARRCVKVTQRGAIACHITITGVQELLAGEVTYKDVRACGYRTTDEFRVEWVRERDARWVDAQELAFPGGDRIHPLADDALIQRFNVRHAFTPCYAISFKLAVDTPRFLAQPGPHQGDYTEQRHRAIDDLEVVDEATLNRFAKDALGFCLGRQAKRAREQAEAKAERGRSMRLAPHERTNRRAA